MIHETRKQIRVIEAETAKGFETAFNEALAELAKWRPDVTLNMQRGTHCAYIMYTETVTIPEDIRDEYELKGIRYICGDCPWFRPSPDRRIKYTTCDRGEYRTTYNTAACLALYKAVDNGEVKL